ncbi:MAG: 4-hydroxy-3-methylbut-2-enyl diphosphate reductase [candidate division Zixibacteria bacterium]|nr:4-hydroxy-3-methylbut-2-enyl diphosphate reductase [candidate division Zixibacteria bacterium]
MEIRLKKIMLARHYGFCMGVKRAIKIAEETGNTTDKGPVNVISEIVHNDSVVQKLAGEGVGTVAKVEGASVGTVIVSAHGQPPATFDTAKKRGLNIVDATCPLVINIHNIVKKLVNKDYHIIHFGDLHHDETRGVVGHIPEGRVDVIRTIDELRGLKPNGRKYALTSQTTAGVGDFEEISNEAKRLFPNLEVFNTICNATTQRQTAVMELAPDVEMVLVVGSKSSANSNRLKTISESVYGKAYLINFSTDFKDEWLDGIETVGITAGASTPDFLVEDVINRLVELSGGKAEVIRPEKKKRR